MDPEADWPSRGRIRRWGHLAYLRICPGNREKGKDVWTGGRQIEANRPELGSLFLQLHNPGASVPSPSLSLPICLMGGINISGDFPGIPEVKILCSHYKGSPVRFLVGEAHAMQWCSQK